MIWSKVIVSQTSTRHYVVGMDAVAILYFFRCTTAKCSYLFTLPVAKECIRCPRCKKNVSLTERLIQMKICEEQYQIGIDAMDAQEPEKAIAVLCTAIDTFHK